MSLVRLLSVGQSLKSFARGEIGFRAGKSAVLPKFGGQPKFASSVTPRDGEWRVESGECGVGSAEVAVELHNLEQQGRTSASRNTSAATSKAGAAEVRRVPLRQGELGLDGVKVVRNDLADSDLEVVRVRRVPAAPVPQPAETAGTASSQAEMASMVWNRLTGRLFEAGRAKLRV